MSEQDDMSTRSDRAVLVAKDESVLSHPPEQPPHLFGSNITPPLRKIDYALVDKTITSLQDIDFEITKKLDAIENLDITINVISYKIYDATFDFKSKINEIADQRYNLLTSVDNKSELSLMLHEFDQTISNLNDELQAKINSYKQQKIVFQEKIESIIAQLDERVLSMEKLVHQLKHAFEIDRTDSPRVSLINEQYITNIMSLEKNLLHYQHLQLTGWRMEQSEEKLADLLEEQGLKFTPSSKLLTKGGSRITFEEAQVRGYLKKIDASLDKIFEFFKDSDDHEIPRETAASMPPETDVLSGSLDSKLCSEDVKYLKEYVGKPLILALAEILTKQPRDPIHYLGHYLFKYRYNQELEVVQKAEIDEFTRERAIMAKKIWKKFVEDEARAAVIDMVLRAEEIAYQNELQRIAEEQMLTAQEEEGDEEQDFALLEEARDKFE